MSKQTAPAIKAPTYNAASFKRDFTALAVQNPKKAATMAGDWRARLENALIEAETATEMALQLATIGGSNLAFSTISGYAGAKKKHIEEQWLKPDPNGDATQKAASEWVAANPTKDLSKASPFKDGKLKDPTKWVGIPSSIWFLGLSSLGAWLARNTDQGVLARGIATGALTNVTAEFGATAGKRMFENQAKKKNND